jgi:hypothetical protein
MSEAGQINLNIIDWLISLIIQLSFVEQENETKQKQEQQ